MSNGGETEEDKGCGVEVLPILGQSSTAVQPCDRPLDDPALGQGHEAFRLIAAFDNPGLYTRQNVGERDGKDRPLIRAVGEQFFEKGKAAEQRRKQQDAAVAILNGGGMNDGAHQQALRIDENVALLALDLLSSSKDCLRHSRADRCAPPFSGAFHASFCR